MRTPHNMTIFHQVMTAGVQSWTSQQVPGVMWEARKQANVLRSGLLAADSATIYVPHARGEINAKVGDYLVKGLVDDVISSTFTITQLKAKYPSCVKINSVDDKDFGSPIMQHWQLGAS